MLYALNITGFILYLNIKLNLYLTAGPILLILIEGQHAKGTESLASMRNVIQTGKIYTFSVMQMK